MRLTRIIARLFMLTVLAVAATKVGAQDRAAVEAQFKTWLNEKIRPEAAKRGVSKALFDQALGSVSVDWDLPGLVPPGSKQATPKENRQAEFRSPAKYFSERTIQALVAGGRTRANTHRSTLARIEKTYGVPAPIILAIWGRESGFGGAKIPHDVFRVLATKGFMSTRPDLFTAELLAALEIVAKGQAPISLMKSSWAGAMGQPQFLPSSYLQYAVDFDGDGIRNIWSSVPDTLASIAHYLKEKGWEPGRDWGFEIALPPTLTCAVEGPDKRRAIGDWERDGVIRVTGRPFPDSEKAKPASVMLPAGRLGPEFLVTPNFYVIKAYNESDLYALFIGHVADRIAYGNKTFVGEWRGFETLYRSDIAAMQRSLERLGHDVGGADGLPGFKTRRSIGLWQASAGLKPTCMPSAALLKALR